MKIEFDIITLLDTAGFVHGVSLGILLFILNKRRQKSTFFLGIFLVLYAFQRLPFILRDLEIPLSYTELHLLPLNFFWLLFPLFYVYTQQVSVFSSNKTKYWLLYPGIIAFIVQLVVTFLPPESKLEILSTIWRDLFFALGIIFSWGVGIYNLKLINLHRIEVRNCYSMIESKELRWAGIFLLFAITGSVLYMLQMYFLPSNIYSRIFYLVFDLTIIYWAAYHGIIQRKVFSLLAEKDELKLPKNTPGEATSQSSIPIQELEDTMTRIDDYMLSSESFVDRELTIRNLAEELNTHPKRISTAINTVRNQNFNYYVNRLRIKKAEQLLKDKAADHLSVEGIGQEVGFHSKSAFYAAFKKFTGTTPTKYKDKDAA